MAVTRCLCLGFTFEQLKEIAAREGLSFNELRERTRCCTGCTTCEPYVRLMLRTGETRFPVLTVEQVRDVMREPGANPTAKQGAVGRTEST